MVNVIKLNMLENRDIEIFKDDMLAKTIFKNNRVLNGDDVFKIFDYKDGNKYEVETYNEHNLDEEVLTELKTIFVNLKDSINGLALLEDQKLEDSNAIDIENTE